ncbi:MAG: PA0069 family radical SAM protein [Verrucomicrobiae bacterium]|nr:PA0069 family radical SAM protein [Verrucomicrobiae bacterium]
MVEQVDPWRGRGAVANPPNRFERLALAPDEAADPVEARAPRTEFLRDRSASVIARNDSPDVPFDASLNPYRGCEHGCAYCYARPTHEYLGFSSGLDFETRILVKEDAPELLRRELASPKWRPQPLALSGVTDAYQPIERTLRLTRRCLEVLAECRNPVSIVTKNALVARDLDLLAELARHHAASVCLSISTLDAGLAARLEPRASLPALRLATLEKLVRAGIPAGVLVAPIIPGLTESEGLAILKAAGEAGATFAGKVVLRLPHAVEDLFDAWLTQHAPLRRERVRAGLRELRGGALDQGSFGARMRGEGPAADRLDRMFEIGCRRAGLNRGGPTLSVRAFRRPPGAQLELLPVEP